MTVAKLVPFLTIGYALLRTQAMPSPAFAQAQRQPLGATVAYTAEAAATVEAVNQQTRQVVRRGAGGRTSEVHAGPAVENLGRVKPGDHLVVRYVEALAASLARPGQGGGSIAVVQSGIARHEAAGSGPVGTVGDQIHSTVTIDAVDRATHTVTFRGPAN